MHDKNQEKFGVSHPKFFSIPVSEFRITDQTATKKRRGKNNEFSYLFNKYF